MGATIKRATIVIENNTTARANTMKKWAEEIARQVIEEMAKDPEWKGYANVSVQSVDVVKWPPEPKSRAAQLSEAASAIQDAASNAEGIKDELESWRNNLPENFQEKVNELDEVISAIEEAVEKANGAAYDLESVEVPGAFGR